MSKQARFPDVPAPDGDSRRQDADESRSREAVERAVADLRRGGAVVITAGLQNAGGQSKSAILVRAAETVTSWPLPLFRDLPGPVSLLVTGRRASILGLSEPSVRAVQLNIAGELTPERLRPLIDPAADPQTESQSIPPAGVSAATVADYSPANAAIRLAKIARLLPAVVMTPLGEDASAWAKTHDRIIAATSDIENYDSRSACALKPVSEARVPLAGARDTRVITFRPEDGGAEHIAVIVGEPDASQPVLIRLHSECLTGDLLGSLRCDCGDQLRGAIDALAKHGSGVLLYLAQEGRGIGLVNKLRAYGLQDKGFDTVDANEQLGYDDDERVYQPAVRMLKALGFSKVRLLTNNPAKVGALARHGIEVAERVPHSFPSNEHNWTYLQTKAKRSGHLL
ncbi:MAG: GTP cyclohydrolase II [Rhodospirillaceae bacterium]|nr:GTP cyclohydrolase II [Rhodospirillaceae bacterium]